MLVNLVARTVVVVVLNLDGVALSGRRKAGRRSMHSIGWRVERERERERGQKMGRPSRWMQVAID